MNIYASPLRSRRVRSTLDFTAYRCQIDFQIVFSVTKRSQSDEDDEYDRAFGKIRPPPSAQAENEKSALFPGKRAEIYFPPRLRPFSGKKGGDFIFRPPEKLNKICPPPKKNKKNVKSGGCAS